MRRRLRRAPARARLVGLVLAVLLLASCGGAWPRPDVVSADGPRFHRGGQGVPLVGVNVYNAASRGNCWYDMRSRLGGTLDRIAEASGGSATVIRVWFFQRLATVEGRRDWTELDRVLATARARGFMVIPVLADQWGACEADDGSGDGYKNRGWYEAGYRKVRDRMPSSYRDWVREVVTRYRDDPTVALWSLVNEAEAAESRSGSCTPRGHRALAAFADDMSAVVQDADPAHLLGLGTIGEGQCGASGDEYRRLHDAPAIDVCEYHDYDEPEDPMPGDDTNGLAVRIAECASLGKPLLVGESGIDPDEVGGLESRADLMRAKADAQFRAGAGGFLLWGWVAPGEVSGDPYGIGPGDPVMSVLGAFDRAR